MLRRRISHELDVRPELSSLDDQAECDGLERHQAVAVDLERPPLVAAVDLVHEDQLVMLHGGADAPVAVRKEPLEHVDVVVALEAVRVVVLAAEALWLKVGTANLEPWVLLASGDQAGEQIAFDLDGRLAHGPVLGHVPVVGSQR